MKAMVLHRFGEPMRMEEIKDPEIGPGEVLVRIKACGVCGTDLKMRDGLLSGVAVPHVPGHEPAGEVVEVGREVQVLRRGDRVAIYYYLTCGKCVYCETGRENLCTNLKGRLGFDLDGGYAELVKVPERNALPIGNQISYEDGSVLADAAITAYHALKKRAQLTPGHQVVVWGSGGVGLAAIQVAKLCGARTIALDIDDRKLAIAKQFGADEVVNVRKAEGTGAIRDVIRGDGVNVVLDTVGHQETVESAFEILCRGGKLIFVGYDPKAPFRAYSRRMILGEFEILGSQASTRQEFKEVIELAQDGKLRVPVSEVHPLPEANEVLERLRRNEILGRAVLQT
jgi:2-desacetyl-2-hydroxyethyl bacteriochlorophyllide A dehydrogenase